MRASFCRVVAIASVLATSACSESDLEVQARKIIAKENARLDVVTSTAKNVRGAATAAQKQAASFSRTFDYRALSAPVGASLSMYRKPEGVVDKSGVVQLLGSGDFARGLNVLSKLSPDAALLVVEGIKATPEKWACTLGYRHPAPQPATKACPSLHSADLDNAAKENAEIRALLQGARKKCEVLKDVFRIVDVTQQNQRVRKAMTSIDRFQTLAPLFKELSTLVEGAGEIFAETQGRTSTIVVSGCVKEGVDREAFVASLDVDSILPAIRRIAKEVKIKKCKFQLTIPFVVDDIGRPRSQ